MSDSPPTPRIAVREATPADLADAVTLLNARDDNADRPQQPVADYLWGLDPEAARCWIAYAGERPVGLTMVYLRNLRWPAPENGVASSESTKRAGYWSHLFVEPGFRKQMVYPQLVLAMLRGMRSAGLDVLFTATRQPDVAEAHQKLGFALVGVWPLRLRPLRPFRLLAKHKGAGFLAPLCGPADGLWGVFSRRRAAGTPESVALDSPLVEDIVRLLNDRGGDGSHSSSVVQQWTPDLFRLRYRATIDGDAYRWTAVRRDGRVVAALGMVMIERGAGIRAGVLMDLVAAPQATHADTAALLADAERHARREGAELMLSLDASLSAKQLGGSNHGYLVNRSEVYHLLVYPKTIATGPAAELANWAFTFGDHDAF